MALDPICWKHKGIFDSYSIYTSSITDPAFGNIPDTWFRPPFWDLLMLQLLRPNSSNLPYLYSTFHLEYPLVLSRFCLGRELIIHCFLYTVIDTKFKLTRCYVTFFTVQSKSSVGLCISGQFPVSNEQYINTDEKSENQDKCVVPYHR